MSYKKIILIETLISAVINGVISAAITLAMFSSLSVVPIVEVIKDSIPQTFFVSFFSVAIPTFIIRARLKSGRVLPVAHRPNRWPQATILRAIVIALLLTLLLATVHFLAFSPMRELTVGFTSLLAFKVVYGLLLSAFVTPWALWLALSEYQAKSAV
ncbi:hypothetical protein [Halioxenophilus sp. WMMB6]|uniref:hypothetical protein n=1 Tax=Halioxenophilus sp. WMMB6 TaxID=3073815 RepID=UPI00295E30DD|nr:hypothetical protein [Halioxenophilus sp. WMMB6]